MQRDTPGPLVSAIAVGLAVFAVVSTWWSEAEACTVVAEEVRWTVPAAGETTVADTPVMVVVGGRPLNGRVVVYDRQGVVVGSTDQARPMAGVRSFVYEPEIEESLGEGTYTVELRYPGRDDAESFVYDFEVESGLEIGGRPGPVDFRWYRETYEESAGDSCYATDEFNVLDIEPPGEAPRYYLVEFFADDDRIGFEYVPPDQIDGRMLDRFEVRNVDCVRVVGIDEAGRRGDAVEHCKPDKCNHFEEDVHFAVPGTTDWSEISGCIGDDGEALAPTDDEAGCRAVTGSGGPSLVFALLVAVAGLVRRVKREDDIRARGSPDY